MEGLVKLLHGQEIKPHYNLFGLADAIGEILLQRCWV